MADYKGLRPMPGHIFVEFYSQSKAHQERMEKNASGIIIPEGPGDKDGAPNQGKVLCVADDIEADIKPGDWAFYEVGNPLGFHWQEEKIIPVHIDAVTAVGRE